MKVEGEEEEYVEEGWERGGIGGCLIPTVIIDSDRVWPSFPYRHFYIFSY